jgi:hypothetical protein
MSNSNWNKKVATIPATEAELEAIRWHGGCTISEKRNRE